MPSIGELFVQLGVVGDTTELKKTLDNMKEGLRLTQKEIALKKLKLKLINDIAKAQTPEAKKRAASLYLQERKAIIDKYNISNVEKQITGQKELASKIAGVVKGVGLFVGALTGAAIALNKLTNDLVASNQAMLNLTRTTDIAQSTFQKWGSIGKMLGVENADQQLADLNQRLFNLMLTGEGARGFQLAGINPVGKDAEGVLEQLRTRISGMNDTTATYLLQQMGLDPQMLHLLRMSRNEFEALGKTIKKYQLTPEQSKQIQQMNIQLQIAGMQLKYIKDRAILALMPAFTEFMKSLARVAEKLARFVKWVKDGSSWGAKLTKTVLGLAAGFAAWSVTVSVLAKTIGFVTTAVKALRLAFLALTAHPIIAGITLLIGALILIVDDIMTYFQGGESVIGLILGFLDELENKINSSESPQWLKDLLALAANADKLTKLGDTISKIKNGEEVKVSSYDILKNLSMLINPTGMYLTNWTRDGIEKMFFTPQMQQNIRNNNSNTVTNNDNKVSMTNYIQTSQTAFDIQQQLNYARFAMV